MAENKTSLRLFNTLTRKKELFEPIVKGHVGLYTCGPTVYNYAHIGNLRAYIFEDVLKRVLLYNKLKVKHVMNITDVGHLTSDADDGEDKMEKGAKREKKTVWEIADFYTKSFKDDIKKLDIIEPDIWCKATDHIKQQIEMIQKIEKNGFTYKTEDGIYFDTSKLDDYGKLAMLNKEGLKAGARIGLGDKKSKTDFALWKFSPSDKKRQMEWDSPWGVGFPGWHIECSAMSSHYLGEQFDIHCGGIDHIPVHHTNEIAQAETATGKIPWVKYWLHCEFLVVEEGKMSKSKGEFLTLQKLIDDGYSPLDYRYLCLNSHYRKQLLFSFEALDGARNALKNLKEKIVDVLSEIGKKGGNAAEYEKRFLEAVNDDLNTPQGLGLVWDLIKDEKIGNREKHDALIKFDEVLGLGIKEIKTANVPKGVMDLLSQREEARKKKDWKKADEVRNKIKELGFTIDDTPEGAKVRKA